MNLVLQQDDKGCGIACCAMVCGHTYVEAKSKVVPHCWSGSFSHFDAFEYLNLHGFSYQQWYRHARFIIPETGSIFPERVSWPILSPFAQAHILLTRGAQMGHWVAMNDAGEIFDPIRGRGKQISDYEVLQIIGVYAAKGASDAR